MRFIDEVTIKVNSGDGGAGSVSFRREKYVPKGGPDGGDGGNGGNVAIVADRSIKTLAHLRGRRFYKAQSGKPGRGKNKTGANGEDCIIKVPVGTLVVLVSDSETMNPSQEAYEYESMEMDVPETELPQSPESKEETILADLTQDGESYTAAKGGKGGKGNARFKTATNQAPRHAQEGTPGETFSVRLELKSLADVGLVGLPNAGKSTLLTQLTNAHPEIGAYPFTTLTPQLGILYLDYHYPITLADIPGLIEGAHTGAGLGIRFLKHIERTQVLLYLIDITEEDPKAVLQTLQHELFSYAEKLQQRNFLLVMNKLDLIPESERPQRIKWLEKEFNQPIFCISALEKTGLDELTQKLRELFMN